MGWMEPQQKGSLFISSSLWSQQCYLEPPKQDWKELSSPDGVGLSVQTSIEKKCSGDNPVN